MANNMKRLISLLLRKWKAEHDLDAWRLRLKAHKTNPFRPCWRENLVFYSKRQQKLQIEVNDLLEEMIGCLADAGRVMALTTSLAAGTITRASDAKRAVEGVARAMIVVGYRWR